MIKNTFIIISLVVYSVINLCFLPSNKNTNTFNVKVSYSDLKVPINVVSASGAGDSSEDSYNVYIHFKEDDLKFEYYSLFDSSVFIFFRELAPKEMTDSLSCALSRKAPILIKYQSKEYFLNGDINWLAKSFPSRLYYANADNHKYIIVKGDIMNLQPPAGYNYLTLEFKDNKMIKYRFTFSKNEMNVDDLIRELSHGH